MPKPLLVDMLSGVIEIHRNSTSKGTFFLSPQQSKKVSKQAAKAKIFSSTLKGFNRGKKKTTRAVLCR